VYQNLNDNLQHRAKHGHKDMGIAFFGGTFTALPQSWQNNFLDLAMQFRKKGLINHVRCSTRPDRITPNHLEWLKSKGLDMVELGVQSFDHEVLHRSRRGYSGGAARAACVQVMQSGLELGIQLMPGLPAATLDSWEKDLLQTCALKANAVRIYPCVVLHGTSLAEAFHRQEFVPWDFELTLRAVSLALLSLWKANIPVIRIGLAPQQDLSAAIEAGPWHPALGQMAKSQALYTHIRKAMRAMSGPAAVCQDWHIFIPRRFVAEFWGHRKNMALVWQRAGFPRNRVHAWEKSFFWVASQESAPNALTLSAALCNETNSTFDVRESQSSSRLLSRGASNDSVSPKIPKAIRFGHDWLPKDHQGNS